jgi:hypothetical protein
MKNYGGVNIEHQLGGHGIGRSGARRGVIETAGTLGKRL